MKEKTLKLFLAAAGGLVAVYLLAAVVLGGRTSDLGAELAPMEAALEAALAGELEGLVVESPFERIELSRGGSTGWQVNGFRADARAVSGIDEALAGARVALLASTNPANHQRMGVAEDSTWRIELRRDGRTVELIVGTAGPNYPSSYVRLPGQDRVYVVNGDLGHTLRRSVSDWRDRLILAVDTARVATLHLSRPDGAYTVTRAEEGWRAGADDADHRMVTDILEQLDELLAQDFPPDTAALDDVVRSIVALDAAGDTLAHVRLSRPDDYAYRAAVSGDPILYEMASWRVERMIPQNTRVIRPRG